MELKRGCADRQLPGVRLGAATACGCSARSGYLGDGVIDFGPISYAVEAAGYDGYVEVEIFNADVCRAAGPDDCHRAEPVRGRPRPLTAHPVPANTG